MEISDSADGGDDVSNHPYVMRGSDKLVDQERNRVVIYLIYWREKRMGGWWRKRRWGERRERSGAGGVWS